VTGVPPKRRSWRRRGIALLAVVAVGVPWWGPFALRPLAFFRVRQVEVHGVRWMDPSVVVARLQVDTTHSVWEDLGVLAARVREHPQVRDAAVARRLPGTLVVDVEEYVPVALVPGPDGFQAFDASGRALPLDPSRIAVDAPVLPARDTLLLSLLGQLRDEAPDVYARVSAVRRRGRDELVVSAVLPTGELPVRARPDVTPARLAQILPVGADLARRGLTARELDLRFRDQVIARLP
jgi:cell division protein FtsQ